MMKNAKIAVLLSQLLALCFAAIWMYASHRYDALNTGAAKGDVAVWDLLLTIAWYGLLSIWALSILTVIVGAYYGWFNTKMASMVWGGLSVLASPAFVFVFHYLFK